MVNRQGPKGRARAGLRDWARKVIRSRVGGPARMYSRLGRRGMLPIMASVHSFKRMGQPIIISNAGSGLIPTLTNATSGTSFNYCTLASNSAGAVAWTVQFGGSMAFMLGQCANTSEITNLFDNYRIRKVVLRFDYNQNSAPGSSSATAGNTNSNAVPLIHLCPDFDDNVVPTSRVDVLQNSYARTIRLDRPYTMALTPRAQNGIAGGTNLPAPTGGGVSTTAAGGLLPAGTWLDCNSIQIPHFGVKFWVDNYNDAAAFTSTLMITPTYYLECKNVN